MIDYNDLGHRIRVIRRKQNLTQEALSEKVGISPSFMGHIERGTRIASLETLVAICNTLKTSPQHLLAASLDDNLTAHMPPELNSDTRSKLSTFLRMAQETISGWED